MINWEQIHLGVNKKSSFIFIGKGELKRNGVMKWLEKSQDKTEEVIRTVAKKMRMDLDKRSDKRPFVGYDIEHIGKLILVKPGYEFEIQKKKTK